MLVLDREKDILKRIKKGDNEAFGELYDFYAPKIYRFIRLRVNSQETAQDLASEAFLKTWQYLQEQRKIRERFQALLYKIVRNLIIDFYRAKSVREILIEDNFEEFSDIEDGETSDKIVILKDEIEEVKRAMLQIIPAYQDIVIWYYIDELSISEISEILDKNEGTIRVLIHRATKAIRRVMEVEKV